MLDPQAIRSERLDTTTLITASVLPAGLIRTITEYAPQTYFRTRVLQFLNRCQPPLIKIYKKRGMGCGKQHSTVTELHVTDCRRVGGLKTERLQDQTLFSRISLPPDPNPDS